MTVQLPTAAQQIGEAVAQPSASSCVRQLNDKPGAIALSGTRSVPLIHNAGVPVIDAGLE